MKIARGQKNATSARVDACIEVINRAYGRVPVAPEDIAAAAANPTTLKIEFVRGQDRRPPDTLAFRRRRARPSCRSSRSLQARRRACPYRMRRSRFA
jgi:hypothetical protein